MHKPRDISTGTISIDIATQTRKEIGTNFYSKRISERDILSDDRFVVVLGDPGSGKTTFVKRLISYIFSTGSESYLPDIRSLLLAICRRDLQNRTLIDHIFETLGYSEVFIDKTEFDDESYYELLKIRETEKRDAVFHALSQSDTLLVLDGIDELDGQSKQRVFKDLADLRLSMTRGGIIATCRSGDWSTKVEGFSAYQIAPLSDQNIRDIANTWSETPTDFLKRIDSISYRQLVDRPLFLMLLIIIFNRQKKLPDTPSDLYEHVVDLIINRIDSVNSIVRESLVEDVMLTTKRRLIDEIAFKTVFEIRKVRFSISDIEVAIIDSLKRNKIRSSASIDVLSEIESHTGLIVESGYSNYEFCHPVLQEYLAACHLVKLPNLTSYLEDILPSAPCLAVASAISSDPTHFFCEALNIFIDKMINSNGDVETRSSLYSFLHRTNFENPILEPSLSLSLALCRLMHEISIMPLINGYESASSSPLAEILEIFFEKEPVVKSFIYLGNAFEHNTRDEPGLLLRRKSHIVSFKDKRAYGEYYINEFFFRSFSITRSCGVIFSRGAI
ncbi:NACHT domain-containing protein [Citromicrobium bathyomarinum]